MKKACFTFKFNTKEEARIIAKTLDPEIKYKIPKTKIKLVLNGKSFFLKIETRDISSLRAACNSYLRWINTAINVKKKIYKF